MASKVMIIGLDCAEPSLVLERWRDELPALSGLMERGRHGSLTSVVPPITVPAWSCMMASRTPGDLGVYGFRNRVDHSYDNLVVADGSAQSSPITIAFDPIFRSVDRDRPGGTLPRGVNPARGARLRRS